MERSRDDFVMGIPLAFSKYFSDNKTDGLVPIESTFIGEYKGLAINESTSHTEIIAVSYTHLTLPTKLEV